MLRASAAAEGAGVPSSTLVCEGFLGLAAASSIGLGTLADGQRVQFDVVRGKDGKTSADNLKSA